MNIFGRERGTGLLIPCRLRFPDGTYVVGTDPRTLNELPIVRKMSEADIKKFQGMRYTIEPVEVGFVEGRDND